MVSVARINRKFKYNIGGRNYCEICRKNYPLSVLRLQTVYGQDIRELLISVSKTFNFKSPYLVIGVLGIHSKKILLSWLNRYLGCNSWIEFKKKFSCKTELCCKIYYSSLFSSCFDHSLRKYYVIRKLRKDLGICSCLDESKRNIIVVKIRNISDLEKLQQYSL